MNDLAELLKAEAPDIFGGGSPSVREAARAGLEMLAAVLVEAGWKRPHLSGQDWPILNIQRPEGSRGPRVVVFADRRGGNVGVRVERDPEDIVEFVPLAKPGSHDFAEAAAKAFTRALLVLHSERRQGEAWRARMTGAYSRGPGGPVGPNWAERKKAVQTAQGKA